MLPYPNRMLRQISGNVSIITIKPLAWKIKSLLINRNILICIIIKISKSVGISTSPSQILHNMMEKVVNVFLQRILVFIYEILTNIVGCWSAIPIDSGQM